MGRYTSGAYIYDELKTLSIADLKRFGYLQPGKRSGVIKWSYRGRHTGDIKIVATIGDGHGFLEFSYIYADKYPMLYWVTLKTVGTNLGIGRRWYFTCLRTGKSCTKLFMADGYFQHRDGIPGAMYRSQTRSHLRRTLDKVFDARDNLYRRNLKWHYRGKPTKRYLRTLERYRAAEPAILAFIRG